VIAVGPGAPNKEGRVVPTSVKAGDRVLLPGWGGNTIKLGEEVRARARRFVLFTFMSGEIDELLFFFLFWRGLFIGIFLVQGFGDFGQD